MPGKTTMDHRDETFIRLENVSKTFESTPVLDDVSISFERGKTTVIIGPSGCGKSVLLKHLIGLLRPDSGKVWFDGHCVSSMTESQLVPLRRKMSYLFQGGALFDSMSVEDNICFPLLEHHRGTRSERRDKCAEVLGLVGLEGLQKRLPSELSGGQQKRVALARAIVMDPELILYDEPTTGLDPIRADLINELILKLQRTLGETAIVVTHDIASARKVADRILMLHEGTFVADVLPDELDSVDDEVVRRFIQGHACPEEIAELRRDIIPNLLSGTHS
jgi:phospholipid/cholesterol/gamma-HCH transport system ATP-binding protein